MTPWHPPLQGSLFDMAPKAHQASHRPQAPHKPRTLHLPQPPRSPLQGAVMYMAATNSELTDHPHAQNNPWIGIMANPDNKSIPREILLGRKWATDNGAYSGKFEADTYLAWLERLQHHRKNCCFAVAPDVLGHWNETQHNFQVWAPKIRKLGLPAAVVAHRGCTPAMLPDADCLFIPALNLDDPLLPELVWEAKRRGMWVHLGRVNSLRRMLIAKHLGCNSADGTYLKYKGVEWGLSDVGHWVQETARHFLPEALMQLPANTTWGGVPTDHERLTQRRREAAHNCQEHLLADLQTHLAAGSLVYDFVEQNIKMLLVDHTPTQAEVHLHLGHHTVRRCPEQVCTLKDLSVADHLQLATRTTGLDTELLDNPEFFDPRIGMDDAELHQWLQERPTPGLLPSQV